VFPFLLEPLELGAGRPRVVFLASTATARELYRAPCASALRCRAARRRSAHGTLNA